MRRIGPTGGARAASRRATHLCRRQRTAMGEGWGGLCGEGGRSGWTARRLRWTSESSTIALTGRWRGGGGRSVRGSVTRWDPRAPRRGRTARVERASEEAGMVRRSGGKETLTECRRPVVDVEGGGVGGGASRGGGMVRQNVGHGRRMRGGWYAGTGNRVEGFETARGASWEVRGRSGGVGVYECFRMSLEEGGKGARR